MRIDTWISFTTRKGTSVQSWLTESLVLTNSIILRTLSQDIKDQLYQISLQSLIASPMQSRTSTGMTNPRSTSLVPVLKKTRGSLGTPASNQYLQHNPGGYQSGLQGRILSVCTPFPSPLGLLFYFSEIGELQMAAGSLGRPGMVL